MKEQITKRIERTNVIAVADGIYGETCTKLATALRRGGAELLELPLNADDHSQVWQTVRLLRHELGDTMAVGIGNVFSTGDVKAAKEAGAMFISSPIADEEVIHAANTLGLVIICGALTPAEIVSARRCGADLVKIYPAETLGPAYLSHIHPVIQKIPVLVRGGITRQNVRLYMHAGARGVFAEDGLYTKEMVEREDWPQITAASRQFLESLGQFRSHENAAVVI